jgi:hypothetical protein
MQDAASDWRFYVAVGIVVLIILFWGRNDDPPQYWSI